MACSLTRKSSIRFCGRVSDMEWVRYRAQLLLQSSWPRVDEQSASREMVSAWNSLMSDDVLGITTLSFQLTAQKLFTIYHHNLNVTMFVIENDGYTIVDCLLRLITLHADSAG